MSAIQKYTDLAKNIEFCDDFGNEPLLLAHITKDRSLIAVVSLLGGFIAMAGLGIPGALMVGFAALNDLSYTGKDRPNSDYTLSEIDSLSMGLDVLPKVLIESENGVFAEGQIEESNFINVASTTVIPEPLDPTVLEVQPIQSIAARPTGFGGNVQAAKPSFSNVTPKVDSTDIPDLKTKKDRPTAVSIFLADPYESRCIFGAQRTGKSYFAAIVSSIQAKQGTRIYHINLASYGTEDSIYWKHAYKSVCCDISSMDTYDAKFQIDKATQLIFDFYADPNPSILIVDEIAYLGSTGNYHKVALEKMVTVMADKITVLSSSGKKRNKAIWTIAPEFVAGAVTQDTKAIKKLTLCYLTIHPEKTVDWEGQDIGFNASLFDQIKTNYSIFYPVDLPNDDRVAYIGNQWLSIGELPTLEEKSSPVSAKVTFNVCSKQTLPKSTSGSSLTLFQRAIKIANSTQDIDLACEIWELEETQHESETIRKLEAICLESSLA